MEKKELEREKRSFEGKFLQLGREIEAKNSRITEIENSKKELDEMLAKAALDVQEAESSRKEHEDLAEEVRSRLEAEITRRESERAAAGEEANKFKEAIDVLKGSIQEKEKAEGELRDSIQALKAEIEERDHKIERDLKYCEGLLRELNELRKRARPSFFKAK